jgi:hypothetical protein
MAQEAVHQWEQRGECHGDAPARVRIRGQAHVDGTIEGIAEEDAKVDSDVGDGDERAAPLGGCHLGNVDRARSPASARSQPLQRAPQQEHRKGRC